MQDIIKEGKYKYIESNPELPNTLMLLHGLFGALSNFKTVIEAFGKDYNVVVPILPIYDLSLRKVGIGGLLEYISSFVEFKGYDMVNVLGNSLGGHISLLYVLKHPDRVSSLILTGSSGLFENAMGSTFPKRGDYQFIKQKTEATFFDPKVATKELVNEVFDIVNDRNKAIRVVMTAKSAIRHNVEKHLQEIKAPTLLVWGKDDTITPAFVGEKFHDLIHDSELHFFERCGHVPMMEHPEKFNEILKNFLQKVHQKAV